MDNLLAGWAVILPDGESEYAEGRAGFCYGFYRTKDEAIVVAKLSLVEDAEDMGETVVSVSDPIDMDAGDSFTIVAISKDDDSVIIRKAFVVARYWSTAPEFNS